ncbi:MAG TPA: sugar phosphate isomerase/epimerase family protein [Fimbriimonadaceae bacterium]|nr:sugar phosphate isomerase/epimerase family protein [Fimbriimonadaceae bacterium]HRE92688.1 sugar phosphate isomerase/epimerase family protein [Fimbriimonadaceae bacterium]HRI73339.1 sugar phosphate isomerase/epimerase family protein [Fimbriimonadaceae bacterium]
MNPAMLLKSINYWSYPGGLEGAMPITEFFAHAKAHGFEAVEVCIGGAGDLTPATTEADCQRILQQAADAGVKIASVASGLYWGNALGNADAGSRQQAREELTAMVQITGWLGARTLLTIPGAVDVFFLPDRAAQPYDEVLNYAREGLKAVAPTAEACGVRMGIENVWNKFLLSPAEMRSFIQSVESPAVGAYVDVANLMPFGHPQDWLRTLGPLVVGIHFKDFRRAVGTIDGFVDLLEGDVPWPDVMQAIADIGYEGPVVAEMIPYYAHYPLVRCANASRAMDAILGR